MVHAGDGWCSGRLVRLAVVLVVGSAGPGAVTGTAAFAADQPLKLTATMYAVTITPGMNDNSPGRDRVLTLGYDSARNSLKPTPEPVYPVALIDVSGLAGVATVQFPGNCRPQGTAMRCPMVPDNAPLGAPVVHLIFRAAPGASAGSRGRVSFTVTARNAVGPAKGGGDVNLVDGPDLVGDTDASTDATVGSPVGYPVGVTNWGDVPVDKFTVELQADVAGTVPPECETRYVTEVGTLVRCTIRQRLAPGEHWAGTPIQMVFMSAPEPLRLTYLFIDPTAAESPVGRQVEPGTSGVFTARVSDADTSADIAVTGAAVHGRIGQTVDATVSMTNLGPDDVPQHQLRPFFIVTFPPGARVRAVPPGCGTRPEDPTATEQMCASDDLPVGGTATYTFRLLITGRVDDAVGRVTFTNGYLGAGIADPNPDNNVAPLTLEVPASAEGSTGHHAGRNDLAAGTGAALLALAALGLVRSRRRSAAPSGVAIIVVLALGGGLAAGPAAGPATPTNRRPDTARTVGTNGQAYLGRYTDPATAAGLTVQLTDGDLGVFVDAKVVGVGEGQDCQLVVVDRHGQREVLDGWRTYGLDAMSSRHAFTNLRLNDIAAVDVETPDRGTLVALHR